MSGAYIKGLLTATLILFLAPVPPAFSQCASRVVLGNASSLSGIAGGSTNFYRNLIIQDLALAHRTSLESVTLHFDYQIEYEVDTCCRDSVKLLITRFTVKTRPVRYYEFDISPSLLPGTTELVFHIKNEHRLVLDSLKAEISLPYLSRGDAFSCLVTVDEREKGISLSLHRAVFHYDRSSYERFRDHLLQVDRYYAAAALADSAIRWAGHGFLAETDDRAELLLRQSELARILRHTRPEKFLAVTGGGDPAGLDEKHYRLSLLNTRYKTLYRQPGNRAFLLAGMNERQRFFNHYLDWLDHYHRMSFTTDFRYVNFLEDVARPEITNQLLLHFIRDYHQDDSGVRPGINATARALGVELYRRGYDYERAGLQTRALEYFQAALELSRLMHDREMEEQAVNLVCRVKMDIVGSYTGISSRSLDRDNPALALQYLNYALEVLRQNHLPCLDSSVVYAQEARMAGRFTDKIPSLLEKKEYARAMAYLTSYQSLADMNPRIGLPSSYTGWLKAARQGLYDQTISRVGKLLEKEDWAEAEQLFRSLVRMSREYDDQITRDKEEERFDSRFRQLQYEDLIDEGKRYLGRDEGLIALYFFNKASFLEKSGLPSRDPLLIGYLQEAGLELLRQLIGEIEYRSLSGDFTGALELIAQADHLVDGSGLPPGNEIVMAFDSLKTVIWSSGCEQASRTYEEMLTAVIEARAEDDYLLALQKAQEAVDFSLEHIHCRIRDEEAWYQKISLEVPAAYQEMSLRLLSMEPSGAREYVEAYQQLSHFYYKHKLLDQGVLFVPMLDRVLASGNEEFLKKMLVYYEGRGDLDQAMQILWTLWANGSTARSLATEQRLLGRSTAARDVAAGPASRPWEILSGYTKGYSWFRAFKWKYKTAWLKESRYRFVDWPLIWKK